jgi:mono/diheme cytochrome c family protein
MRKLILYLVFSLTLCAIIYSCQNESEIAFTSYLTNGKEIYKTNCQNCHGEKGEGLGLLAPPLTDSVFLQQNKSELACLIKNGSNKPMIINGKTYEGKMPAFKTLEDIEIAQLIVYITNSFGHKQGMYTYKEVNENLKKCNP